MLMDGTLTVIGGKVATPMMGLFTSLHGTLILLEISPSGLVLSLSMPLKLMVHADQARGPLGWPSWCLAQRDTCTAPPQYSSFGSTNMKDTL